jgi:hypothetical protein
MPKYKGKEVEVRIASSEAGLDSAPAIPYVTSIRWDVDKGIASVPKGLGSNLSEVYDGVIKYSGRLVREFDETAVSGSDIFATVVGAFSTTTPTLYIQIKNVTSGRKETLKKVKGKYSQDVGDVDGFITETYDFEFEEVSTTAGS